MRLTIVGTNDIHGWVDGRAVRLADGSVFRSGGTALFAGYLDILSRENPGGVILLDAGDVFQGTLISNLSEGEAVIAAYNALGYDAVTLGNHEFDHGPVGPVSVALGPEDDPCGALKARAAQARFPLLARNVYDKRTGERLPFLGKNGVHVVTRKGVAVGIVGLLTPTTPTVTNPVNVRGLAFGELLPEAVAGAAEARARGAQVTVLLVHAGGQCRRLGAALDPGACDASGEVFKLLEALPPGAFDVVVAGHVHSSIATKVGGAPVIESYAFGRAFGVVEVEVPAKADGSSEIRTRIEGPVEVCERVVSGTVGCDVKAGAAELRFVEAGFHGSRVVRSDAVDKLLAPYRSRVAEVQSRSLGVRVPAPLTRDYHAESLLGDALTDAMRAMEQADVALINPGGLRTDVAAGELTYGALYEVFPFDNALSTLKLTGAELVRVLRDAYDSNHGAMQVSGVKVRVERCGTRVAGFEVALPDGSPVELAASYKVVMSDFLALGGDGLKRSIEAVPKERVDYGYSRPHNMRDALAHWLEQRAGTLEARLDGRIRIVERPRATCPRAGRHSADGRTYALLPLTPETTAAPTR